MTIRTTSTTAAMTAAPDTAPAIEVVGADFVSLVDTKMYNYFFDYFDATR